MAVWLEDMPKKSSQKCTVVKAAVFRPTRNRADPTHKANVDEWVGVVVDIVGVIDDNQGVIFVRTFHVPIEGAELQQTTRHGVTPRTEHRAATLGDFTEQLDLHDTAECHARSCDVLDLVSSKHSRATYRQQCLAVLGSNNHRCKAWWCNNKSPKLLASPGQQQCTRAKVVGKAWS